METRVVCLVLVCYDGIKYMMCGVKRCIVVFFICMSYCL